MSDESDKSRESPTPQGAATQAEGDSSFLDFRVPRWVKLALIPGVVGPALILGFIVVTELAHDEARCPYHQVSTQTLSASIVVREDGRRCLPGVEERRYTAVRGTEEHLLGRRRFSPSAFDRSAYHWQASLAADQEVHISVHNEGHADAEFREGTPEERAQ